MRVNNLFYLIGVALIVSLLLPASPVTAQEGLYGAPKPLVFNLSAPGRSTPLNQFSQSAYRQVSPANNLQPGVPVRSSGIPANSSGTYQNQVRPNAGGNDWLNTMMSPPQTRLRPVGPTYGQETTAGNLQPAQLQPTRAETIPMPAQQSAGLNSLQPPSQTNGSFLLNNNCSDCGGVVYDGTCTGCGNDCDETICQPRCNPWYGSAQILLMTRNQPNGFWTSADFNAEEDQVFKTNQLGLSWKWGGEIRIGRRFSSNIGCECVERTWALEAAYWSLEPFTGFKSVTIPGSTLVTPIDLRNVTIAGQTAGWYFDNSPEHRIWRWNEVHSIELNLLSSRVDYFSGPRWNVDWLVGLRYFRFNERLIFGAVNNGYSWGQDPSAEGFMEEWIDNNLVGVQFGLDTSYCWQNRGLSFHFRPRVGLYNNSINQIFSVYNGDGVAGTQSIYSLQYPVRSSKNVMSFMTQLDIGLSWEVIRNLRLTLGYRAVVLTGMGLADDQFPQFLLDTPEIRDISTNSTLVLHGGYAGVEFNY